MVAMHRIAEPFGLARDDYEIFTDLAERLGAREPFTEGRTAREWLAHLYEPARAAMAAQGLAAPDFEEFWQAGSLTVPQHADDGGRLRRFRDDPTAHPLPTPSGRIEVFSKKIAGHGDADCPGHPVWLEKTDVPKPGSPFFLIANQPTTRLHSQLDFGGHSLEAKHRGREVARMNPRDAEPRGIADGDIIRLFNIRGACLAAVHVTDAIAPGMVQLPTGAWYDPMDPEDETALCVHGNPNVLTRDVGTSSFAQGCTGQITTVEVERFNGNLPPIRAFDAV
jgi:biotin/methionine sulfoxide reductase